MTIPSNVGDLSFQGSLSGRYLVMKSIRRRSCKYFSSQPIFSVLSSDMELGFVGDKDRQTWCLASGVRSQAGTCHTHFG